MKRLDNLFSGLSHPKHDARLGQQLLVCCLGGLLCLLQYVQALLKACPSISYKGRTSLDGLDVMRKDIQTRGRYFVNRIDAFVGKVGRQGFDQDARCFLLDFRYS